MTEGLSIRTTWGKAAVMTAASLFIQIIHWVVFDKVQFDSAYLWFTPLIFCLMYRLLMADCESGGKISKGFIFSFTVAVPFLLALLVSVYMIISYPDISTFSAIKEETGSVSETISIYSGRIVLTSGYLLIYSLLDLLIISKIWKKTAAKKIRNPEN